MSLEQALKENTTVLRELMQLMASQPRILGIDVASTPDSSVEIEHSAQTAINIEDLTIEDICALSTFWRDGDELTPEHIKRADEIYNPPKGQETPAMEMAYALRMAILGTAAKSLFKTQLLALCCQIIDYWEELSTMDDKRVYIQNWLGAPQAERAALKPEVKKAKAKTKPGPGPKQETKPQPEKTTKLVEETKSMAETEITINEVKGPFMKLAAANRDDAINVLSTFGAAKLGDVPQDKLGEVLVAIEAALLGV